MNPGFNCNGQMADVAEVNVMNRVPPGGGEVMVWAGKATDNKHNCILSMAI
jgi:hypothetical protein